jgi:hypothetical protein
MSCPGKESIFNIIAGLDSLIAAIGSLPVLFGLLNSAWIVSLVSLKLNPTTKIVSEIFFKGF